MAEKRIQPKAAGTEASKGTAAAAGVQKKSQHEDEHEEDDEEDARQISCITKKMEDQLHTTGPVSRARCVSACR